MVGISCAPEMHQKCIQQLIQHVDGAYNILDDIILHGTSREENDKRLIQVLGALKNNELTLNKDKYELNIQNWFYGS